MARHELDLVSLVSGVVFVVLGVLWFGAGEEDFLDQAVWVGPVLLMLVGLVLLASTAEHRSAMARLRGEQVDGDAGEDPPDLDAPSAP